jgi:hypothetical protein
MSASDYTLTPEQEAEIYGIDRITVLSPDSEKCIQPNEVKVPLKYHQLSLINYCKLVENSVEKPFIHNDTNSNGHYKFELSSKSGIIGDIVGSGKTLSILGLISSTIEKKINNNPFENKDQYSANFRIKCVERPIIESSEVNTTLVVVPHTIFKQWDKTIAEQTTLKYMAINNSKSLKKFEDFRNEAMNIEELEDNMSVYSSTNQKWDGNELEQYDVILVSSTFYGKMMNIISYDKIKVKRIIFDEADSIKIQGSYLLKNSFVWYVTSTFGTLLNPSGIRMWCNSQGEISNYYSYSNGFTQRVVLNGIASRGFIRNSLDSLSYIDKRYLKYFVVKNQDDYVSNAFNLIPPNEQIIKCKMPLSLRVLSHAASAEILSFINAGDIQGAVESLDCDKVSETGLINAVTKDLSDRLENKQIEFEMKSKMNWSSETVKKDALEKIQFKIKEINQKIQNIKEKLDDSSHCNICFDTEMTCPTVTPCCNTKFCFECITKWLAGNGGQANYSCPFCRAKITPSNLIVIDNTAGSKGTEKESLEDELDKLETLKKILEERFEDKSTPMKVLIFSEYYRAFDKMTEVLDGIGIKYSKIQGTTNTVNKKIREYKTNESDGIDCLLLNAEYCASGLNLENTTDIIITHKMSNEKTAQIIGRGQRPGRSGQLNVWKLYYETEM